MRVNRWIIATLLVLLTGCSAVRLTYGQGALLAYWWMDRYLDFTSEQAPLVRGALADWFAWHRQTQLPEYADWLRELQPIARDNVTPEMVCQVAQAAQRRIESAYEHAVPLMAPLVRTLTPAQLDHLAQRYARNNKEAERDFLQPDPQERAEASLKRTVERAEMVYGSLDEPQRELVAAGLATSPFDPQRWLTERRARQQDILRTLRQLHDTQADDDALADAGHAIEASEHAAGMFRPHQLVHGPDQHHRGHAHAQREQRNFELSGWRRHRVSPGQVTGSSAAGRVSWAIAASAMPIAAASIASSGSTSRRWMRSAISSAVCWKARAVACAPPRAEEGSGQAQCVGTGVPGHTGQISCAALSQTVMTRSMGTASGPMNSSQDLLRRPSTR